MGQRVDAPRGLFPTKAQGVLTMPFSALPRGMRLGKLASKFEQMLNLCEPQVGERSLNAHGNKAF